MADTIPKIDPDTEAALRSLADIVTPPPVSWMPQTWGWVLLAVLAWSLIMLLAWRWLKRWRKNRYRREALRLLRNLDRDQLCDGVPELLKRVALAAWPREHVAHLSGKEWVEFLAAAAPGNKVGQQLAALLAEDEYKSGRNPAPPPKLAGDLIASAALWIEKHHVST